MNSENQTDIDQAIALLARLHDIMDVEQQVLTTPGLDGLDTILVEKQELLGMLAEREERLTSVLKQASADKKVTKLTDLLNQCRQRNEENNSLTLQGMKNTNRSISFLRSMLQTDASTTYDTSGKTGSGVDKRNLGLA